MPEGLKNSVTTLQRMMEKVLTSQRGRNVEVYLEEIVVKSKRGTEALCSVVEETLRKLKRVNIKIDPNTSSFGVEEGKFLWHYETMEEGYKGSVVKKFFSGHREASEETPENQRRSGVGYIPSSPMKRWHSYAIFSLNQRIDHAMDLRHIGQDVALCYNGMKDLHVFIDSLTLVAQIEGNHTPTMEQERKYKVGQTNKIGILNQEVLVGMKTRPSVEEISGSKKENNDQQCARNKTQLQLEDKCKQLNELVIITLYSSDYVFPLEINVKFFWICNKVCKQEA
ncbi:hypothetical protein Tco_1483227 [Tanacetum coccineum]